MCLDSPINYSFFMQVSQSQCDLSQIKTVSQNKNIDNYVLTFLKSHQPLPCSILHEYSLSLQQYKQLTSYSNNVNNVVSI